MQTRQGLTMLFKLATTYSLNGEILTAPDSISADGASGPDVSVLGGVSNQQVACSVLLAKLQLIFIVASQPVTLKVNGTNAVQSVTISGGVTGGTFTLTYGAQTTAPIAWNASAATVQAALAALSSIGTGNVAVTGSAGGPWSVTFMGTLGVSVISAITYSTASLTGGTPAIAVATTTTGVVPAQTISMPAGIPIPWRVGGYFACPFSVDVVNFYLSNAGSVAATVNFRFGQNA
jgi:hypothetical protein